MLQGKRLENGSREIHRGEAPIHLLRDPGLVCRSNHIEHRLEGAIKLRCGALDHRQERPACEDHHHRIPERAVGDDLSHCLQEGFSTSISTSRAIPPVLD